MLKEERNNFNGEKWEKFCLLSFINRDACFNFSSFQIKNREIMKIKGERGDNSNTNVGIIREMRFCLYERKSFNKFLLLYLIV